MKPSLADSPRFSQPRVVRTEVDKNRRVVVNPASFMPRYWVLAWRQLRLGDAWSENTENAHMHSIDALYMFCDTDKRFGPGSLDKALGELDNELLLSMVEAFQLALTDVSQVSKWTQQHWDTARMFLTDVLSTLNRYPQEMSPVIRFLASAGRIKYDKIGAVIFAKALPQSTLDDFLDITSPGSKRNPRKGDGVQWRNWLIVNILLRGGLRRGELLLLTTDSLCSGVDSRTGEFRYWLNVNRPPQKDDDDEEGGEEVFWEIDNRYSKPGIKTAESVRQIPVDETLVELWEFYVSTYRPDGVSNFLLTADGDSGLSKESVDRLFQDATMHLTEQARKDFSDRTNGKTHVSPHDLRHTCATMTWTCFAEESSGDREECLIQMRAFFGWSLKSEMPNHYARAAITDSLMKTWQDNFSAHVANVKRFHAEH